MGKKNIQPTTSSPVSRTLVVAPRPALEELRAEPQEGHISSLTGPEPNHEAILRPPAPQSQTRTAPTIRRRYIMHYTLPTTETTSKNFSISHNSRKCQKSFPSCFGGLFASTN
jgi:hypothetical protein